MGTVKDYLGVVVAWVERAEVSPAAESFVVIIRGRKPKMSLPEFLRTARPSGEWLASVQTRGQFLIVRRDDPIIQRLDGAQHRP